MSDEYQKLKQEYEDFAYIISHDLNTPLRHLKQFSGHLIDQRKEPATEEERIYVKFISSALENLESMLTALLNFSRLSTQAEEMQQVKCDTIISEISDRMQYEYANHELVINCTKLPEITADKKQFQQLLYCIIDNAIKFHKPDSKRECWITHQEREKEYLFSIKDNGIGIRKKFHEQVFNIFRRLNKAETYPGAGAGLTYAKKIIERHNGKIWIESEPEIGTTVYFTLPKAQPDAKKQ